MVAANWCQSLAQRLTKNECGSIHEQTEEEWISLEVPITVKMMELKLSVLSALEDVRTPSVSSVSEGSLCWFQWGWCCHCRKGKVLWGCLRVEWGKDLNFCHNFIWLIAKSIQQSWVVSGWSDRSELQPGELSLLWWTIGGFKCVWVLFLNWQMTHMWTQNHLEHAKEGQHWNLFQWSRFTDWRSSGVLSSVWVQNKEKDHVCSVVCSVSQNQQWPCCFSTKLMIPSNFSFVFWTKLMCSHWLANEVCCQQLQSNKNVRVSVMWCGDSFLFFSLLPRCFAADATPPHILWCHLFVQLGCFSFSTSSPPSSHWHVNDPLFCFFWVLIFMMLFFLFCLLVLLCHNLQTRWSVTVLFENGSVCCSPTHSLGLDCSSCRKQRCKGTGSGANIAWVTSACCLASTHDRWWCVFWPLILRTKKGKMMTMKMLQMTNNINCNVQQLLELIF